MLIQELLTNQENMSAAEKAIADYFLQEKENIRRKGVRRIAAKIFVAPSSIIRFCQKIGFDGLQSFKDEYIEELRYTSHHFEKTDPNIPFTADNSETEVAGRIAGLYQETVLDTLSLLDSQILQEAVSILDKPTIYIITLSAQRGIAKAFEEKMGRIGRRVIIHNQTHKILFEIEHSRPEDCAFLFLSYTGESSHCIVYAEKALAAGHHCAAITSYGINRLSSLIPCTIRVSSREKLISNLGNYSFALSALYVLDVIYSLIFRLDYDRNSELKIQSSKQDEKPLFPSSGRHSGNPMLNE
jgi:DNA-binding MurR/RpiR family transcriptional regulator